MIPAFRRLGAAVLMALAILTASVSTDMALIPTAAPAEAVTPGNSVPFPGNPHWLRQTGLEAVVQYHVDGTAKALHPVLADAVSKWNEQSPYMHLQLLPLGGDCRGQTTYCVTVAEANNRPCGSATTFLNWDTTSYGHHHFYPAFIAVNLQDCGLDLLEVVYVMCHEVGHSQGVEHDPQTSIRPCSPGDARPVQNDYNVRNILGASPG